MAYSYASTTRPTTNQTSIGGVSAVNPQAKTDFQGYVDASYNAAKQRLDPVMQQQQQTYQQSMVDRSIPVGSEAYGKSSQQLDQNQNDAYSQAAFNAMQFGLGAQAQDFGQDATRSQLSNALLQSKWGNELGWGNNALGYAGLNEQGRQFDKGLNEQGRQFDNTSMDNRYFFDTNLGENARQFDSSQDFNYWDRGSQFDYMYDRAGQNDLQWLMGYDRDIWNDQTQANRWSDQLGNNMLQPFDPNIPNVGGAIVGAQNQNLNLYSQRYDANRDFWGDVGGVARDIPWEEIWKKYGGSGG